MSKIEETLHWEYETKNKHKFSNKEGIVQTMYIPKKDIGPKVPTEVTVTVNWK